MQVWGTRSSIDYFVRAAIFISRLPAWYVSFSYPLIVFRKQHFAQQYDNTFPSSVFIFNCAGYFDREFQIYKRPPVLSRALYGARTKGVVCNAWKRRKGAYNYYWRVQVSLAKTIRFCTSPIDASVFITQQFSAPLFMSGWHNWSSRCICSVRFGATGLLLLLLFSF